MGAAAERPDSRLKQRMQHAVDVGLVALAKAARALWMHGGIGCCTLQITQTVVGLHGCQV
jgi:hypothetical protein